MSGKSGYAQGRTSWEGGGGAEGAKKKRPSKWVFFSGPQVVALLGQVERIAATAGLPLGAFVDLARAAVDDVAMLGPASALTGPAARGDWATLDRHLASIDPSEHAGYSAGVGLALELSTASVLPPVIEDPVDDVPEVRNPPAASLVG